MPFTGAHVGTAPLTWGQKAIWQDMQDSGNQFSMGGMTDLPEGSTVADAAARLSGLMSRHAALRMRLGTGPGGRPCQQIAGSGEIGLDILEIPGSTDRAGAARYAEQLMDTWPLERFDFRRDWPLRMAVLRHRGACLYLVWVLSHLVADGAGHFLFLDDLCPGPVNNRVAGAERPQITDVAGHEQTPQLRQLSGRAMRRWEAQLRHIPAVTFGGAGHPPDPTGEQYWQARFSSPASHLAIQAIAGRTGADTAAVTLAVIATAIGRATGAAPLTVKVMMSNRFRPGLADVIAPIAQNSVLTIDVTGSTVDEVVARTRSASLTAGMRAYYDPDDLAEVTARLDAERGYPASVTCRVNDQRAMVRRPAQEGTGDVTPAQIGERLPETALTWIGPRHNMHEQVNILIENRPGTVSLHLMWHLQCLTGQQAEALLRGVEEVAVEAAFDPAAPTRVPGGTAA